MSAAERLREAGKVLREKAKAATPGPWSYQSTSRDERVLGEFAGMTELIAEPTDGINAAYIATMHPGVGLALADWLYEMANDLTPDNYRTPLRLADLILGGEDQ